MRSKLNVCAVLGSVLVCSMTARVEATRLLPSTVTPLGPDEGYFVPNQGQWPDEGVYLGLRSHGLDIAFRESSLTIQRVSGTELSSADLADKRTVLTVRFPGSNDVQPVGALPQRATFNYFVGGDHRSMVTEVPSFREVVYEELYDGIELRIISGGGIMKYEFHVATGADRSQIRMSFEGIDSLCMDSAGNLQISTACGILADASSVVWQAAEALRSTIPTRFEYSDDHAVRIVVNGHVDRDRESIIDLEIEWSGGPQSVGKDEGRAVALDSAGNWLVTGRTESFDFAGRSGAYYGGGSDGFIAKVSASGILLWMTYIGGSGDDAGRGVAVDSTGDSLVTGWTTSSDFNGRNNAHHGGYLHYDAFVVKVSASGALRWMSYLGGSGYDEGWGIAVDRAGNSLVTGRTDSSDFEGQNNALFGDRDAYVAKVSASGNLQWVTYLGGSDYEGGHGIAVDAAGNSLVAGSTRSIDFKGGNNSFHDGGLDAFIVKVSASGVIRWMTYLGGSEIDSSNAIAVDAFGNSFVTGYTESAEFEGRNNAYQFYDAFVVKVSPSGALRWMTYLGGGDFDEGHGIAVDSAGNALVAGESRSTDFCGRNNAHHGGNSDAFVVKIGATGILKWMSYLGGSGNFYERGYGIAVDDARNSLVTGYTNSTDFEGRNNEYHGGTWDAFVVRVGDAGILHWMTYLGGGGQGVPQLIATSTCPSGGPIHVSWTGATADGDIALLLARDTGSCIIPNDYPCAGAVLGLGKEQLQIVHRGSAGSNGSRVLNAMAGPSVCASYLQLLDLTNCTVSNVVRID